MSTAPPTPAGRVVVVGSANADLVASCERLPEPGETVLAHRLAVHPGGKGLNQAVAAARDGAPTLFVGAVGTDANAEVLRAALRGAGVDTTLLGTADGPSGTALICVEDSGANTIVVVPGANSTVSADALPDLGPNDVVLLQLEIPLPTVADVVSRARAAGATVLLNAAPATAVDPVVTQALDLLLVNEVEALRCAGELPDAAPDGGGTDGGGTDGAGTDPEAAARALLCNVPAVVLTRGDAGAVLLRRGDGEPEVRRVAAPRMAVLDTTAAGDTFAGVLAAALVGGSSVPDAVARAVVAGSVSVTRSGAVPSIPNRAQIDAAMPG